MELDRQPTSPVYNGTVQQTIEVVAAVLTRADGKILICRRAVGRASAGMWEFPGGKVEEGEDARDALRRELREELAIEGEIGDLITRDTTAVGDLLIDLACYRTALIGDEPLRSTDHDEMRWTSPEHLNGLHWALPDLKAVAALRQGQSSP